MFYPQFLVRMRIYSYQYHCTLYVYVYAERRWNNNTRKFGGHGLLNVKQMIAVECETFARHACVNTSAEPLLFAVQNCNLFSRPTGSVAEFKSTWRDEFTTLWKQKLSVPITDRGNYHYRMCLSMAPFFTLEMKRWSLLLRMKLFVLKFIIWMCFTHLMTLCRLRHLSTETIFHVLNACPALALSIWSDIRNSVASLIHKHICEYNGIATCSRPWLYKPQPGENVKILWDFTIYTDHPSCFCKPARHCCL